MECQVNVKSQSELGGRETCFNINVTLVYGARVKFGDTLRSTLEGNTFNDFNYL